MSDAAKSKAKQKCAFEKPKLDNARQLRGIFFIEPDDEEVKHTLNNARRKLAIPMSAAMSCKTPTNCRGETCRSMGKCKTKYACVVDADESARKRLEGVPHRYHEDHVSANRLSSLSRYNLVHRFIPIPEAVKNTGCEGSSGKIMGKLQKIPAWQLTKVRNKERSVAKSKSTAQNQRCKRATVKLVGNSSTKHAKTNSNHEHQSGSDQH